MAEFLKSLGQHNILASGFTFEEGESGLLYKFKILNSIMVIAAIFSLLFAALSDLGINDLGPIHTNVDYLYSAISVVLVLLLRRDKSYFPNVAKAFLVTSLFTFTSALHYVPQDEFRLIWFYFLVYVSYVLLGSRAGVAMTVAVMLVVVVSALFTQLHLSEHAIYTGVLGILVGSLLSRTHTVQIRSYEELLRDKNTALEKNVVELDAALQDAQQADSAKSLFLANISHEIRTPMNGILGMVQVMQSTELSTVQRQYLETIDRSGKTLLVLLDELLDLSKIESDTLEMRPEPFDLYRWAADVRMLTEPLFEESEVEFITEVDGTLSAFLVGDAARLMQIVINLIANAAKFTLQGEVRLRINTVGGDERHCRLHVSVEDSGIGIPEDKHQEIFSIFTQLSSDQISNKGVGLGLSISAKLVAAMGGRLQLESSEGVGSRFWFEVELPLTAGNPSLEPADSRTVVIRPWRILLVDDDAINRLAVRTLLNNEGHHVDEATNGQECIDQLGRQDYDVVLMDVHMPGMNGVEATRRIRRGEGGDASAVPIIGLTASVMRKERESYLEAGMDAVVMKPVLFGDLLHILQRCLQK